MAENKKVVRAITFNDLPEIQREIIESASAMENSCMKACKRASEALKQTGISADEFAKYIKP